MPLESIIVLLVLHGLSDCEHVNDELVKDFPIPDRWDNQPWSKLTLQLFESLEKNATRKVIKTKQGHTIEYDEIKAALSKGMIDKIDRTLAEALWVHQRRIRFHHQLRHQIPHGPGGREQET